MPTRRQIWQDQKQQGSDVTSLKRLATTGGKDLTYQYSRSTGGAASFDTIFYVNENLAHVQESLKAVKDKVADFKGCIQQCNDQLAEISVKTYDLRAGSHTSSVARNRYATTPHTSSIIMEEPLTGPLNENQVVIERATQASNQ